MIAIANDTICSEPHNRFYFYLNFEVILTGG